MNIEIKKIRDKDIKLLEKRLPRGGPEKHLKRLKEQQKGNSIYLIAWHKDMPVGHAFLKFYGRVKIKNVPDIEDIFVSSKYRGKGIGSQLIKKAEALAKQQGYSKIGLGVGVENKEAISLYQRMGYRDSRVKQFRISGSHTDKKGKKHSWEETCIYLIKDLIK